MPALSFVREALTYAEDITASRILASWHVHLAAERFLEDYEAALKPGNQWEFREDLANKAMLFASLLPNIKGPQAGKPLQLMGWQKFSFANIFGFVERGTNNRRFHRATVFIPRGNGKSSLAAPLALYMTFAESEGGAEGYTAAVTRDQARIVFDIAQQMVKRTPRLQQELGVGTLTNAIFQERTASRLMPISSDAKALDGLNVTIGICDEVASHKTPDVWLSLNTAMAKRTNPFLFSISTATGNTSSIGKNLFDGGLRVLQKSQEDDRLFCLIYGVDDSWDIWDETTWIAANPGFGLSVQPDALRAIFRQARNNPAQEAAAKTRHLNIWVGADDALFSLRAWQACTNHELQLADYHWRKCHLAIDLASKTDLAAIAIVFPEDERYSVFTRCYLNEAAVLEARNASYPGWAADGDLIITPGEETDFTTIEDDIIDLCKRFRVESIAYDPWASTQLAQRLQAQGLPMVEFRSTTQNFSEPTKELDAAMRAGRIQHDGNGVLTWCIGNTVGHYDARSNVYPRKARPENKIDAAVALIMAIARCMTAPGPSVYESRGLLSL